MERITVNATADMEISEVLDLSLMSKIMDTSIKTRIRSHFSNLRFEWKSASEIDVNGQKMSMFDVISFIEYLSTFKVVFLSADFQNFPVSEGAVVDGIFKAVEENSAKLGYYRIENDKLIIDHSSLTQICLEVQETDISRCRKVIQKKFLGITPIQTLELELSSVGTSVYPRNVLRSILDVIRPTTVNVTFAGSTEAIPPILFYSDDYPKFEFISDPISSISPKNVQKFNCFYGKQDNACLPFFSYEDEWVTVTSHFTSSFLQFMTSLAPEK